MNNEIVKVKIYDLGYGSFELTFKEQMVLNVGDVIEFPNLTSIGTISGYGELEVLIHRGKGLELDLGKE